jgi:hypothetical protein
MDCPTPAVEELVEELDFDGMLTVLVKDVESFNSRSAKVAALKSHASSIADKIDIGNAKPSRNEDYDRNYLARMENGWEMMLIVWAKGDQTTVHGHPELCCYRYIKGRFKLELFELCPKGSPQLKQVLYVSEDEDYAACGEPESYCNHIHRVTCLGEVGYSLNIYSDDARLGTEYEFEN